MLLWLGLGLAACGGRGATGVDDAAATDAAPPDVAIQPDAALADAAQPDAATTDAALPDAALADAALADAAPPDAGPPLAADFTLTDLNPASPTFGQPRSVSGVLGKVLLIHFPSFG